MMGLTWTMMLSLRHDLWSCRAEQITLCRSGHFTSSAAFIDAIMHAIYQGLLRLDAELAHQTALGAKTERLAGVHHAPCDQEDCARPAILMLYATGHRSQRSCLSGVCALHFTIKTVHLSAWALAVLLAHACCRPCLQLNAGSEKGGAADHARMRSHHGGRG